MSNVSSTHSFARFDKASKPLTGQRLARIMYKTDAKTGKKPDSYCVSIPLVGTLSDAQLRMMHDEVIGLIHTAQDGICKERYQEKAVGVTDAELSFEAVLAYLGESGGSSGRITTESVVEWFNENLSEALQVAFADALGISDSPSDEENIKIEMQCLVYRENFAKLASGKTSFQPVKAAKLLKSLDFASADDALAGKFKVRLQKMVDATDDMLGL